MNIEEFQVYCLSKPLTTEDCPFGPETLVYRVAGKIFALTGLDSVDLSANLKCEPEYAIELRERYGAVQPGYHMNKKLWNTVHAAELNDDNLLKKLIDHSYVEVVNKMPKKTREEIFAILNNTK